MSRHLPRPAPWAESTTASMQSCIVGLEGWDFASGVQQLRSTSPRTLPVVANFFQGHIAGRIPQAPANTCLGDETSRLLGEYFIVRRPVWWRFQRTCHLKKPRVCPVRNAHYGLLPLRSGQTVLLQGTGGVSTFGLQIALAAGAISIVTTSSNEELAKPKRLGARHGINYRAHPDWAREMKKATGGKGADHIIEIGLLSTWGFL
ncbi:hypothetical protein EPUS_09401 [Endocarpon pusillum Z07020]|uniref:Alcohol dehydrogenase-like C-terminal domain-containing protein n=1 Tax=Endocarpon pusillum (strain Z07020 / HMAS-L-300199) TaxID=1263415 RepID=U1GG35_ENDPU|nr:uncharacterized protein EPUS_09401 [Endocarpon pusillum Z07020]ERF70716.1 hypothetical protein EPUS_09401 [Endocarpon pusillum Z07020]